MMCVRMRRLPPWPGRYIRPQVRSRAARLMLEIEINGLELFAYHGVLREERPGLVNQVGEVKTELRPRPLLDRIHVIERQAGRKRSGRWGPRTLHIDILWYDDQRILEMHLQVPHPRIEERRFVLEPWSELAPGLVLPSGRRVREAVKIVTGQRVRRLGIGAEEE